MKSRTRLKGLSSSSSSSSNVILHWRWCRESAALNMPANLENSAVATGLEKVSFYSNPKGNQSWIFIGRSDSKAETPIPWPPVAKNWLIWKDSDAGRDWGKEEKGMTEDEMAGWHHRLDGREFEWTPGVGDGQGSLACCNSWGCKELDTTEQLNWTDLIF